MVVAFFIHLFSIIDRCNPLVHFCYEKDFGLTILFLLMTTEIARAGFGITPPYVRNTSLTRNSTYEQQILLVRGNPDESQKRL